MNKLASGLIFLTASAMPVAAADLGGSLKDTTPALMQVSSNWTGFWVAGMIGLQFHDDVLNYDESCNCSRGDKSYGTSEGVEVDGLGSQGVLGEIQIGYDRQLNNKLLVGIMAGLNIDDSEFEANIHASNGNNSAIAKIEYSQKWGAVIGPRLGWIIDDTFMVYGSAGVALSELEKIKYTVSGGGNSQSGVLLPKQETDLIGPYVELGMEKKLREYPGLALKLAGRYTDYGAIDLYRSGSSNEYCDESTRAKLNRDSLAVMFGVKYSFGDH